MSTVTLVEELAQKRFYYETLFEDQAAILRRDPVELQRAYDPVSGSLVLDPLNKMASHGCLQLTERLNI